MSIAKITDVLYNLGMNSARQTSLKKYCTWVTLGIVGVALSSGLENLQCIGLELQAESVQIAQVAQKRAEQIRVANDLQETGKFAEAQAAFQKLVTDYPDDAVLRYKLGKTLSSQRKFEEAIAAYQQAIRLDANYAVAHNALGTALASQGRSDEAVSALQRAIGINTNYPDPLKTLGQLLLRQGKKVEATTALEKAKTLFQQQSRFQEMRQVDQLLQEIKTATPDPA